MKAGSNFQIVWYKRDLRVDDHAPLTMAASKGPVLPLYIIEPELWQQPDMSLRQWEFARESLIELRHTLAALGQPLVIRSGDAVTVITGLLKNLAVTAVWSHLETGNHWTYQRDRAVAQLLREHNIPWHQERQQAVVRGVCDRDRWSKQWEKMMRTPIAAPPADLVAVPDIEPGEIPDSPAIGLSPDPCPGRQSGGRSKALNLLDSFLNERGSRYHLQMSSPNSAQTGCSRLSPYLAWGTISLREVVQATRLRRDEVRQLKPAERGTWGRALSAFEGRLHWHCHFIQKLESEPELEFQNMLTGLDGLRDPTPDPALINAWADAQTGWPFVDACMRALVHNGWINFRMRAMLMSVASYHLWLHWREPALYLARRFVDYEPGIHYPQVQMQSGTTGINTIRIYNPVKQSMDQDPEGEFIRRWLPELHHVEDEWIHTPWLMPKQSQLKSDCVIDRDYPSPLVDYQAAAREARQKIYAARREIDMPQARKEILHRHGSRKKAKRARPKSRQQLNLQL